METRRHDSPLPGRRAILLGLLAVCIVGGDAAAQTRRERLRERRRQRRERRQQRQGGRQRDQDWAAAREAVRRGEIEPLRVLMRYFQRETGFEIVQVRYRQAAGQHFYGFKVVTEEGRLEWFAINAATREILTREQIRSRYGH